MRLVTTALAAGWAIVLSGCGVPEHIVGIYSNPDAGLISLDDEWRGDYKRFAGDVRASAATTHPRPSTTCAPGDPRRSHRYPSARRTDPGALDDPDEPAWDRTSFEFRVEDDIVTLLPYGGEPVNLRLVDGDLVLMQPGGLELVFRR